MATHLILNNDRSYQKGAASSASNETTTLSMLKLRNANAFGTNTNHVVQPPQTITPRYNESKTKSFDRRMTAQPKLTAAMNNNNIQLIKNRYGSVFNN